jgi:hypothetical protein
LERIFELPKKESYPMEDFISMIADKDDKALDAAKRGLGFVSAVLDKVSIWNWQKK